MGVQCQNPWRLLDRRGSGRVLPFETDGHLVLMLAISCPVESLPRPPMSRRFSNRRLVSSDLHLFDLPFFLLSLPILLFRSLVAPCL
jgi:hypothetical protein